MPGASLLGRLGVAGGRRDPRMRGARWTQDRADPHDHERALVVARQDPPFGLSLDEAVADVRGVMGRRHLPECPSA
jgi:hypothetical protein